MDPILPTQLNAQSKVTSSEVNAPAGSFESVLEGVEGETSATRVARFSELQESFYDWRSELDTTHPLNLPRYDQVMGSSDAFLGIVEKAVMEDGYSDPLAFVQGLSGVELDTLKAMHSTGDLNPATMTEEGALNLILPFNERQDIDNDGFVEKGHGVGWSFPPVNAPQHVHDAWKETTEGMTAGEKMMAEAALLPSMLRRDNATGEVTQVERSESNNPYARAGFSYVAIVQQRLDSLEAFKHDMSSEQYDFKKDFLTRFRGHLSDEGTS
ncbi:hypothetical protein [Pelagicoccus sp. SDUM812002]|uniref:hypothetical protein n=1 Tax=Pelagicoccus sp. SDUM812002 TaxID=3041266 RepID=UPI0028121AF0|nr:hypothetical protein [Pelagicoccus sp. SDUM812002]